MNDSSTLSMIDSFFGNRMDIIINAGFKSNSTRLWSNYGYFKTLSRDFPVENFKVLELAILYINLAYFNNKYGKRNAITICL